MNKSCKDCVACEKVDFIVIDNKIRSHYECHQIEEVIENLSIANECCCYEPTNNNEYIIVDDLCDAIKLMDCMPSMEMAHPTIKNRRKI